MLLIVALAQLKLMRSAKRPAGEPTLEADAMHPTTDEASTGIAPGRPRGS